MRDPRLHEHFCEVCFQKWEHSDSACYHDYRKFVKCDPCLLKEDKARIKEKAFAEWAASLPIPHTHICPFCGQEWPHDDRRCAAEEIILFECKACCSSFFNTKNTVSMGKKDEGLDGEEDDNVFGPY